MRMRASSASACSGLRSAEVAGYTTEISCVGLQSFSSSSWPAQPCRPGRARLFFVRTGTEREGASLPGRRPACAVPAQWRANRLRPWADCQGRAGRGRIPGRDPDALPFGKCSDRAAGHSPSASGR
jgi:hypothetical protein